MSDYIGITIGPIVKTLSFAETPAQLWYASYLFSSLTEKICENLSKEGFAILSPYYMKDKTNDGIGRYHDRIIVNVDCHSNDEVENCICKAKEEIINIVVSDYDKVKSEYKDNGIKMPVEEKFYQDGEIIKFLNDYISVHWVRFDVDNAKKENPILKSGYILDMLEQMPSLGANDDSNIFKIMFGGKSAHNQSVMSHSNEYMSNCRFLSELSLENLKNFFTKKHTFRSISDIAGSDEEKKEFKKYSYFAVVQADVDSMGNYINGLSGDDEIKKFSEKCFKYVTSSAKIITDYGAMVIYAGGDDLLFLAPVENGEKNVFDLICDIKKEFEMAFELKKTISEDTGDTHEEPNKDDAAEKSNETEITVSFGVSIRYEKYPLYEAFESARNALFGIAKGGSDKNSVAVDFSKHSGQAMKLCIPFERFESFCNIIKKCQKPADDEIKKEQSEKQEEVVNSAIYNIDLLKDLLINMDNETVIMNVLNNQYDNKTQEAYRKYIEAISKELYDYLYPNGGRTVEMLCADGAVEEKYKKIKCFELMMRFGKFLSEEGKENG